ncbi:MAG: toprim domain-containing protein [Patulibacter minatonensis]
MGVGHVVALMGTAMTSEQVTELSRLAPLLVLALDPDGAGQAAMEKAAALARGSRLELRVAELPGGRDPAELVQDGPRRGAEGRARAADALRALPRRADPRDLRARDRRAT